MRIDQSKIICGKRLIGFVELFQLFLTTFGSSIMTTAILDPVYILFAIEMKCISVIQTTLNLSEIRNQRLKLRMAVTLLLASRFDTHCSDTVLPVQLQCECQSSRVVLYVK